MKKTKNKQIHQEQHINSSIILQDFVIGMADGLTVPFALVAGLSKAVDSLHIIVVAGLSEIAAGTIAMGLGGYLAAKTEREHYEAESLREIREIEQYPEEEVKEVEVILEEFGITEQASKDVIVNALKADPTKWHDFMMRFELKLEKPARGRELQSSIVIGSAYALGGFIPLSPYMFSVSIDSAFKVSVIITVIALFVFGVFKGVCTGSSKLKSGLHTSFIGGIAASAAYFIARLLA